MNSHICVFSHICVICVFVVGIQNTYMYSHDIFPIWPWFSQQNTYICDSHNRIHTCILTTYIVVRIQNTYMYSHDIYILCVNSHDRIHICILTTYILSHACDSAYVYSYVRIHICENTHVTRLGHVCDRTHSYMWHDPFIDVTWLIHICDMTHSCMRQDSFVDVTWPIHRCESKVPECRHSVTYPQLVGSMVCRLPHKLK